MPIDPQAMTTAERDHEWLMLDGLIRRVKASPHRDDARTMNQTNQWEARRDALAAAGTL